MRRICGLTATISRVAMALLLVAGLSCVLAGCSQSGSQSQTEDTTQATESQKDTESKADSENDQSKDAKSESTTSKEATKDEEEEPFPDLTPLQDMESPTITQVANVLASGSMKSAPYSGEAILTATEKDKIVAGLDTYPDVNLARTEQDVKDMFTLSIDGSNFTLPCKLQSFYDAGWSSDVNDWEGTGAYSKAPEEVPGSDKCFDISLFKGASKLDVVATAANDVTTLGECAVFEIKLDASDSKLPSVALKSGVKLGSSLDDVLKAYGRPAEEGIAKESDDSYRLGSVTYSQTDAVKTRVNELKERLKKMAEEEAKANGDILLIVSPLTVNTASIGSKKLNYDALKFEFSKDDGNVRTIDVFNSYV